MESKHVYTDLCKQTELRFLFSLASHVQDSQDTFYKLKITDHN